MQPYKSYPMTIVSIMLIVGLTAAAGSVHAASAHVLDAKVDDALKQFYQTVKTGEELAGQAKGVLVFPSVIKAGIGIGGEFGEGALRIGGKTVDYYNTAAASIGLQLGAQAKTVILIFMTDEALKELAFHKENH
jgi:lipid-binding SYLF domain-containing protein